MSRFAVTCALALALSLALAAPGGAGTLFVIDGRGWGHGVGMSQYGAQGYALDGWRYSRILAHYYPGTVLQALPARAVRVLLAERASIRIGSAKPFRVVGAAGKKRTLKPGDRRFSVRQRRGFRFPIRLEAGASPLRVDGSAYRGTITLHRVGARLTIVNHVPLDRYLRGVVPWEMPYYWHPEALKAQAVVARSYALATLRPTSLYDTYADTRSQVYGGIQAERITTNRAIAATRGRVLLWQGQVATTFYHSTSGGRTAPVDQVWPKASPVPYLVSVPDPHDTISKHHRWGPVVLRPGEVSRTIKVAACATSWSSGPSPAARPWSTSRPGRAFAGSTLRTSAVRWGSGRRGSPCACSSSIHRFAGPSPIAR